MRGPDLRPDAEERPVVRLFQDVAEAPRGVQHSLGLNAYEDRGAEGELADEARLQLKELLCGVVPRWLAADLRAAHTR